MQTTQITKTSNRLGIVIVAYGNQSSIKGLLDRLQGEKLPGDKMGLIDNHPDHLCADIAEQHGAVDLVIRSDNIGFAAACNLMVRRLKNIDLILLLNPDTLPEPKSITYLRDSGKPEWGGWMGLLTLPDKRVNSAGNAVHLSGLSWCLGYGDKTSKYKEPFETTVLSGADMIVRKSVWDSIGGFDSIYFLYYEDTDLSYRITMAGYKLGVVPAAKICHDYDFGKSKTKWFYIERNRYLFIMRTWPAVVVAVLLPLLILMELGLWVVSIKERRFILKARSSLSAVRALPHALRQRRKIRLTNQLSNLEFLDMLEPKVNTPLVSKLVSSKPVTGVFVAYYRIAYGVVKAFSRSV